MATYAELYSISQDPDLIAKVSVAVAIAAEGVRLEDPELFPDHTQRANWAITTLLNPDSRARQIMWMVLAQKKDATLAQITEATDAVIQAAVDDAVAFMLYAYG